MPLTAEIYSFSYLENRKIVNLVRLDALPDFLGMLVGIPER